MKRLPLKVLLTMMMVGFWVSCEKPEITKENVPNQELETNLPLNFIGGTVKFVSLESGQINLGEAAEYYASNYGIDLYSTFDELMQNEELSKLFSVASGGNLRTAGETMEVDVTAALDVIGLSPKGLEYLDAIHSIGPDEDLPDSIEVDIDFDVIKGELSSLESDISSDLNLTDNDQQVLLGMIDIYSKNYEEVFEVFSQYEDATNGRINKKGWLKRTWRKVRSVVITTAVVVVATVAAVPTGGTSLAALPFILGGVAALASTADVVLNDRCWYATSCAPGWCQTCSTGSCLVCTGSTDYSGGSTGGGTYQDPIPAKYDCAPGGSCTTIQLNQSCSSGGRCDQPEMDEVTRVQLAYLKKYGAREFAELAESILNDFKANPAGITVGDYWEIRVAIQDQYLALKGQYLMLVTKAFAEVAEPIVEIALAEVVTEFAIKRIQAVIAWKMAQTAQKVSGSLTAFQHASKYGIKTISELKRTVPTGSGLHKHHLFEQRFASKFGVHPDNMLGIVLTPAEHKIFTVAWRTRIGYQNSNALITTTNATKSQIEAAAREIYAAYPDILRALKL